MPRATPESRPGTHRNSVGSSGGTGFAGGDPDTGTAPRKTLTRARPELGIMGGFPGKKIALEGYGPEVADITVAYGHRSAPPPSGAKDLDLHPG
jgi:hypothetical protein